MRYKYERRNKHTVQSQCLLSGIRLLQRILVQKCNYRDAITPIQYPRTIHRFVQ